MSRDRHADLTPRPLSFTHPAQPIGRLWPSCHPSLTGKSMRDKGEFLFTSESVSEGHPDKVADRLSDTVLDAFLAADPYARVACETLVTTNRVVLAGETRGPGTVTHDYLAHLARLAIQRHRLRAGRLSLAHRRRRRAPARPVGGHRAGRGLGRQQGRGRRRPGHHVRLCLHRNADADAGAALLRPRTAAHHPRPAAAPATAASPGCCPTPKAR